MISRYLRFLPLLLGRHQRLGKEVRHEVLQVNDGHRRLIGAYCDMQQKGEMSGLKSVYGAFPG